VRTIRQPAFGSILSDRANCNGRKLHETSGLCTVQRVAPSVEKPSVVRGPAAPSRRPLTTTLPVYQGATATSARWRYSPLLSVSSPGDRVAGVYGSGGKTRVFFTAGHTAMSFSDRRGFLAGAEEGALRSPEFAGAVFSATDPGRLGGTMRCASLVGSQVTACVFADAGAYGVVTVFGPVDQGQSLARTVREAVEHRS